jgi:hypothetical protein
VKEGEVMESRYAIYLIPESFLEPNPIGWVLAQTREEALRRASRILRIGLDISAWWA